MSSLFQEMYERLVKEDLDIVESEGFFMHDDIWYMTEDWL